MQPVEFREPSGLVVILRTSQERLILHCDRTKNSNKTAHHPSFLTEAFRSYLRI